MTEPMILGTRIYYRGDMANAPAKGMIVAHHTGRFCGSYDITLDDGREVNGYPDYLVATVDCGTCATRICTLDAYNLRRAQQIEQSKAEWEAFTARREAEAKTKGE